MSKSARRRAREFALQGIYQWLLSGNGVAVIEQHMSQVAAFDKADGDLFRALLRGAIGDAESLRAQLTPHLARPLDDVSPVEHALLLLAAHELKSHPETPYRVVINEAIELAKEYGGTDGHRFVNGVVDKLALKFRFQEMGRPDPNLDNSGGSLRPRQSAEPVEELDSTHNAYTQYWTGKIVAENCECGRPHDLLDHTSDDNFLRHGVRRGDRIFVVNIADGVLFLVGKMTVAEVLTGQEAKKKLGRSNLYGADDHLIAVPGTASIMRSDRRVPLEVVKKLELFRSDGIRGLAFVSGDKLDRQALRGVCKLTPVSAAMLESVLSKNP